MNFPLIKNLRCHLNASLPPCWERNGPLPASSHFGFIGVNKKEQSPPKSLVGEADLYHRLDDRDSYAVAAGLALPSWRDASEKSDLWHDPLPRKTPGNGPSRRSNTRADHRSLHRESLASTASRTWSESA
jgi:hypothetical protein